MITLDSTERKIIRGRIIHFLGIFMPGWLRRSDLMLALIQADPTLTQRKVDAEVVWLIKRKYVESGRHGSSNCTLKLTNTGIDLDSGSRHDGEVERVLPR